MNENIIYSYTRKQAIEDGMQVCLSDITELNELCENAGYKWPIYITSSVYSLVEKAINNEKHCNDIKGVMWDILYMSKVCSRPINEKIRTFQVIITGTGNKKLYDMYIEAGPIDIDNSEPCLTIMLPEER